MVGEAVDRVGGAGWVFPQPGVACCWATAGEVVPAVGFVVGDGAEAGDAVKPAVSSSAASIAPHDTLNAFTCCCGGKPNTMQAIREVSFAIVVRRA
ncbi:hypothetical protein [Amycolatopsis sp. NPDC050768]|uniref:hypothetical protein n=1 Tax=Amycolatopsis sp. NPDC050768 TaxID=3154839 RepID=UPI00340C6EB0